MKSLLVPRLFVCWYLSFCFNFAATRSWESIEVPVRDALRSGPRLSRLVLDGKKLEWREKSVKSNLTIDSKRIEAVVI